MTRIIGGVLGSLKLKSPAKVTRPTSDRVKESIFSILESMDAIEGSKVLDLFAGTGALGLEAASRGAQKVILVERDGVAASICRENLEKVRTGLEGSGIGCELGFYNKAAEKYVCSPTDASLIFVDPPYELRREIVQSLVVSIANTNDCLIVLERSSRESLNPLPPGLNMVREASYGDTKVYFLTKRAVQ